MTEYYMGVDVHKTKSQVAVIDEHGEIEEEVRVKNANLDEIAQKYAGSEAALEATMPCFSQDCVGVGSIENCLTA